MALINPGSVDNLSDLVSLMADPKALDKQLLELKKSTEAHAKMSIAAKKAVADAEKAQKTLEADKKAFATEKAEFLKGQDNLTGQRQDFARIREAFDAEVLKYNEQVEVLKKHQEDFIKSVSDLEVAKAAFQRAMKDEQAILEVGYKGLDSRAEILSAKETAFHEMKTEHLAKYAKIKSLL